MTTETNKTPHYLKPLQLTLLAGYTAAILMAITRKSDNKFQPGIPIVFGFNLCCSLIHHRHCNVAEKDVNQEVGHPADRKIFNLMQAQTTLILVISIAAIWWGFASSGEFTILAAGLMTNLSLEAYRQNQKPGGINAWIMWMNKTVSSQMIYEPFISSSSQIPAR